MIDQHDKLREVAWNELFRWLSLLRCVRVALMARILVLGAMGLILTSLGWWTIDYVVRASNDPVVQDPEWREVMRDWLWKTSPEFSITTSARNADDLFLQVAGHLVEAPVSLWLYMTRPFIHLFNGHLTPIGFFYFVLCGIWELFVWGLFGGAITRIAALKLTRDEAPDLIRALQHSSSKILSYSMAPLLALAGAAVFGLQLFVLGFVMRWSLLAMIAGLAWPFVLLLGLLMAILLIGALVGWPLMFATVSVEGTDAFDALSRSYAYVYQRPLRLLWYVLLAAILAAVSMFIVKLFATSAIALGSWSVSWGLNEQTYRSVVNPQPELALSAVQTAAGPALEMTTTTLEPPTGMLWLAAKGIDFWKTLLGALAAGYQAGFLWVAAVGVYLLLRKDVDGAEMDEVYVEDEPEYGMPPLAEDMGSGVPEVRMGETPPPPSATPTESAPTMG